MVILLFRGLHRLQGPKASACHRRQRLVHLHLIPRFSNIKFLLRQCLYPRLLAMKLPFVSCMMLPKSLDIRMPPSMNFSAVRVQ
jgi:hypothetical protein